MHNGVREQRERYQERVPVKPSARLLIVVLLGAAAVFVPGVASTAAPRTCADAAAPLTVEEQRLAQPETGEVLQRSGFDRFAKSFTPARSLTGGHSSPSWNGRNRTSSSRHKRWTSLSPWRAAGWTYRALGRP